MSNVGPKTQYVFAHTLPDAASGRTLTTDKEGAGVYNKPHFLIFPVSCCLTTVPVLYTADSGWNSTK